MFYYMPIFFNEEYKLLSAYSSTFLYGVSSTSLCLQAVYERTYILIHLFMLEFLRCHSTPVLPGNCRENFHYSK